MFFKRRRLGRYLFGNVLCMINCYAYFALVEPPASSGIHIGNDTVLEKVIVKLSDGIYEVSYSFAVMACMKLMWQEHAIHIKVQWI